MPVDANQIDRPPRAVSNGAATGDVHGEDRQAVNNTWQRRFARTTRLNDGGLEGRPVHELFSFRTLRASIGEARMRPLQ